VRTETVIFGLLEVYLILERATFRIGCGDRQDQGLADWNAGFHVRRKVLRINGNRLIDHRWRRPKRRGTCRQECGSDQDAAVTAVSKGGNEIHRQYRVQWKVPDYPSKNGARKGMMVILSLSG
jgi:hypothetical protein